MQLEPILDRLLTPNVIYPTIAASLGALVSWTCLRISMLAGRVRADADASDRETESRDLRRTISLLQNENKNLSTFLMTMPELARQLNSSIEKRKLPELLVAFIEQLFEAEQILIFLTANDRRNLMLAGGKGLPAHLHVPEIIPIGRGRIGWVAEHQITMDENDFTQKARAMHPELTGPVHPRFRSELCAPMVSKDRTLGVISLGGLLRRPKNEKNMLKMVADLGSIAIQNTLLFTQIQMSANHDGLTEIANKRHFMARLADELLRAEKEQKTLSLFLFDIDHFKIYNDTNGHLAGDEALKITGRLLTETIRQDDMPARYGGEEFAVLLPGTDKQGAMTAAEKIRKAIESCPFPNESSQPLGKVTISGGVATFPFDARSTADLIRCADQALYEGKRAGRNRVVAHQTKYFSGDQTDIALDARVISGSQSG
ncbi:MAG TPA: sensor domain-containing diguanylate cyclase [Candidatus Polarisedimenticolia bacterium]|nr:sensor domain-containing diguanylate cyclase [Candidatus Polarisedimenticolia bacterium]